MVLQMIDRPEIKVGDRVIISQSFCEDRISAVVRETKTQLIINNGERYRKSNYIMVGSNTYVRRHIRLATAEDTKKLVLKRKFDLIKKNIDELNSDQIEQIYKIMEDTVTGVEPA